MYENGERLIFGPYPSGRVFEGRTEMRYGDPLAIHRTLYSKAPDFRLLCERLWPKPPEDNEPVQPFEAYLDAAAEVTPIIGEAFGLTLFDPITGEGYETRSCVKLLGDFLDWCSAQKKTPLTTAVSQPSGASVPRP